MALEYFAAALAIYALGQDIEETEQQARYDKEMAEIDIKAINDQIDFIDTVTGFKRAEIGRQETLIGIEESKLGVSKELLNLGFHKDKLSRALQSGDIKLAQAEATKGARIESEQVRLMGAQTGASSFARAYGQMTVNKFATFEQKTRAMKQEGLMAEQTFGWQQDLIQFGMQELGVRRGSLGAAKEFIGVEAEQQKQQLGFDIERAERRKELAEEQEDTGVVGDIFESAERVVNDPGSLFDGLTKGFSGGGSFF